MCGGIDDGFNDGAGNLPLFSGVDLANKKDMSIFKHIINNRVYYTDEPFTDKEIDIISKTPENVLLFLFKELGFKEYKL